MTRRNILLPLIFAVLSLSYSGFILQHEPITMVGDEYGYDPGGKIMPLLASLLIFLTAVGQIVKNRNTEHTDSPSKIRLGTVLINVIMCGLLIFLLRRVGFILSVGTVLYILIIFNVYEEDHSFSRWKATACVPIYVAVLMIQYRLIRWSVKLCCFIAGHWNWPVFRETTLQAGIAALLLAGLLLALGKIGRRKRDFFLFSFLMRVASGTTLGMFIIFRMLFLVQLPPGLLIW